MYPLRGLLTPKYLNRNGALSLIQDLDMGSGASSVDRWIVPFFLLFLRGGGGWIPMISFSIPFSSYLFYTTLGVHSKRVAKHKSAFYEILGKAHRTSLKHFIIFFCIWEVKITFGNRKYPAYLIWHTTWSQPISAPNRGLETCHGLTQLR